MLVLEKSHDAGGRQPKFTTPGGAWGGGRGGDQLLRPSLVPCACNGQSRKLVREGGVQRPNGRLDRAPEQHGCPLTGEPPEGKAPASPVPAGRLEHAGTSRLVTRARQALLCGRVLSLTASGLHPWLLRPGFRSVPTAPLKGRLRGLPATRRAPGAVSSVSVPATALEAVTGDALHGAFLLRLRRPRSLGPQLAPGLPCQPPGLRGPPSATASQTLVSSRGAGRSATERLCCRSDDGKVLRGGALPGHRARRPPAQGSGPSQPLPRGLPQARPGRAVRDRGGRRL